jgi:phage nucleotide-binding protein
MGNLLGLKSAYKSVLIYGHPGTGKTTALGKLRGKTLILDTDNGTIVLADSEADIEVVRFDNDLKISETFPDKIYPLGMEFKELIAKLDERQSKYTNICLDTASEFERRMLSYYGKIDGKSGVSKEGVPAPGDYQKVQFKLLDNVRLLRNIKANLIVTAWESPKEIVDIDGSKRTMIVPQLNDKIRDNLCGLMDIIAHLEIAPDDKTKRIFRLSLSTSVIARDKIYKRSWCEFEDLLPIEKAETKENKK